MVYDEIIDFDSYDDIEPEETFEDILNKYNTSLDDARIAYAEFIRWFDNMLKKFEITSRRKILVCLDYISYTSSHDIDDDSIRFWCVCISEENYFLFDQEDDERYNLTGYLRLKNDIDNYFKRIKTENDTLLKFHDIVKNISFTDKTIKHIDISKLYHAFCIDGGLNGVALKDNLDYATDMICHSQELIQIAPLVYYALFTRYKKKFLDTQGFEPNFENLLRGMKYVVDIDNGKNINNFNEHISIYRCACFFLDKFYDKYLCDTGFAAMSNITECTLLDNEDFIDITLPIKSEVSKKYFEAFPMGLNDNPLFKINNIDIDEFSSFIDLDEDKIESLKIIPAIRSYISSNTDISNRYIKLIRENRCDECMDIVFNIIDNSDIKKRLKQTYSMDVVNAVIIEELHSWLSTDIKRQLMEIIDIFNS